MRILFKWHLIKIELKFFIILFQIFWIVKFQKKSLKKEVILNSFSLFEYI
jgi:hypothetical protein